MLLTDVEGIYQLNDCGISQSVYGTCIGRLGLLGLPPLPHFIRIEMKLGKTLEMRTPSREIQIWPPWRASRLRTRGALIVRDIGSKGELSTE